MPLWIKDLKTTSGYIISPGVRRHSGMQFRYTKGELRIPYLL